MSRSDYIQANLSDFTRGCIGALATIAGSITAEHIEIGLRWLSHMTGIAVGLVTIWSIVRRARQH